MLTYLVEGAEFGSAGDEGHERLAARESFDERGNSVRVVTYDNRGSAQEETERTYDQQGRLVEEVTHDIFTDTYDRRTFTYDDARGTVEEIQYYGVDAGERTLTRNNSSGQSLEITKWDADGELESRHLFVYDAQGRCTVHEEFEGEALTKTTETRYDDTGRPVREVITNAQDPEANHVVTTTYADTGHVTESHDPDGQLIWRETATTSDDGNHEETIIEHFIDPSQGSRLVVEREGGHTILTEQFDDDDELNYRRQVAYDDDRITEEALFYSANYRGVAMHVIRRFRYEFDERA
jgi:YD repeat-containing protein